MAIGNRFNLQPLHPPQRSEDRTESFNPLSTGLPPLATSSHPKVLSKSTINPTEDFFITQCWENSKGLESYEPGTVWEIYFDHLNNQISVLKITVSKFITVSNKFPAHTSWPFESAEHFIKRKLSWQRLCISWDNLLSSWQMLHWKIVPLTHSTLLKKKSHQK